MIYFSDLDRTLIYSNKFISDEKSGICIEVIENKEISYISHRTIDILKELLLNKKLIPTTTRSIEQYKRLKFCENDVEFEWSIVSNGGNILYNGEVFSEWKEALSDRLKSCETLENTMNYFNEHYSHIKGITKVRSVDDIFFYIVVDRNIYHEYALDKFKKELIEKNWTLHVNGRKIYFIPKVITKEAAIAYLLTYLGEVNFEAIGDSIMDLNMLRASDKGYITKNSYLEKNEYSKRMFISEKSGFKGIEEILTKILQKK